MKPNPKILVIDNEIDICNFVKSFFEMRGFKVTAAYNGEEGLKIVGTVKPDLIILDVMMRYENEGLEYLPKLRQAMPSAKILMITGVDEETSIKRAKESGADDYITKPLVLEYLESTVMDKVKHLV